MNSKLQRIELENGLKLLVEQTNDDTIAIAIGVKIGSIFEKSEVRGISHLLEHMMFKSNRKYSYKEISSILELLGGDFNAFSARDKTVYYAEVLRENFPKVVDVLYHMFVNDCYKESEFEKEKSVVLSEIRNERNNSESWIWTLGPLSLYGKSDLGDPIMGYEETLANISKAELEDFKAKYYVANNMQIVLVGGISRESLEIVKNLFRGIEGGSVRLKRPERGISKEIVEIRREESLAYYAYTWEVPGFKQAPLEKANILYYLLTEGSTSLLFDRVREQKGLSYSVGALYDVFESTGYFSVVVSGFLADKIDEVRETIREILKEISERKLDKSYIEGRKNYTLFSYKTELRDLMTRASLHCSLLMDIGKSIWEFIERMIEIDWNSLDLSNFLRKGVEAIITPR